MIEFCNKITQIFREKTFSHGSKNEDYENINRKYSSSLIYNCTIFQHDCAIFDLGCPKFWLKFATNKQKNKQRDKHKMRFPLYFPIIFSFDHHTLTGFASVAIIKLIWRDQNPKKKFLNLASIHSVSKMEYPRSVCSSIKKGENTEPFLFIVI